MESADDFKGKNCQFTKPELTMTDSHTLKKCRKTIQMRDTKTKLQQNP
jgi:hypothetical protein